jgi:hypothetical protein
VIDLLGGIQIMQSGVVFQMQLNLVDALIAPIRVSSLPPFDSGVTAFVDHGRFQ